mgnify:CR=1 FL=1
MSQEKELALKIAKEIVIKFIETNKISLSNFENSWKTIYETVKGSTEEKKKNQ